MNAGDAERVRDESLQETEAEASAVSSRSVESDSADDTERTVKTARAAATGIDPTPRAAQGKLPSEHLASSNGRAEATVSEDPELSRTATEPVGDVKTVARQAPSPEGLAEWKEGVLVAGRYRILHFVGQGGMGKVYLAQDQMLDRPIALKRIPQEILFDADARDDLLQEANRLLDLAHDNIVRIHTYYDGPTWPFIAMEYLRGPTLKQLLRARKQQERTFSVEEVTAIATHVAQGLFYAHSKGIVHRDLKPGNLMLAEMPGETIDDSSTVKITDFGISRVIADGTLRQTGRRTGTLPYMSPEQFRGEFTTSKSDIYSFCCTLYELLSGRPPFHTGDIGYQILSVAPKPLEGVPRGVGHAILRGLAKRPEDRFESVDHFLQALEGKISVTLPPIHRKRFHRVLKAVAAILVLVAIFFVGTQFQKARSPQVARMLIPPARQTTELDEFAEWITDGLKRVIPETVGPEHFTTSARGRGNILKFDLPRPPDPRHQEFFDSLILRCHNLATREDADYEPETAQVTRGSNETVFSFSGLTDGSYFIEAVTGTARNLAPFRDENYYFRVDRKGPAVELNVVQRGLLVADPVDDEDAQRRTFAPSFEVELEADEILGRALYRRADDEGAPWLSISDPKRWTLPLSTLGTNTFDIKVFDQFDNDTEFTASFERLRLQLRSFKLDGAVFGDRVNVVGQLLVEGGAVPALRYIVNTQPVEAEAPFFELAVEDAWDSQVQLYDFGATLRLTDHASNKVEVQYALDSGVTQPLPGAGDHTISALKVSAPEVRLTEKPRERINERIVVLKGVVTPYFEGLEMSVLVVSHGEDLIDLIPDSDGKSAKFEQSVQLIKNDDNIVRFKFSYVDELLSPSPPALNIYCDLIRPDITEVEYDAIDLQSFYVTIRASELLQKVRVRPVPMDSQPGEWVEAELFLSKSEFRVMMDLPEKPIMLEIEAIDVAGNIRESKQFLPHTKDRPPSYQFAVPGRGLYGDTALVVPATHKKPGEDSAIGGTPRVGYEVRSTFLHEMDLDFRPFGSERLEMGTTEITERVWAEFERDTGRGTSQPRYPNYPKVFTELTDLDALSDFIVWFEGHAQDGYSYRLPSAEEWLCSFAQTDDVVYARARIRRWFFGEGKDSESGGEVGPTFTRDIDPRYGFNARQTVASRGKNRTPGGLYDMEANVQELVQDGAAPRVIGGFDHFQRAEQFHDLCTASRMFNSAMYASMTGFRLLRWPRSSGE